MKIQHDYFNENFRRSAEIGRLSTKKSNSPSLTYDDKNNEDTNPAEDAELMAKVEPADDDLGNGTSRHDYNENNGAKLFDCQGDENLTQGRSTRFFQGSISILRFCTRFSHKGRILLTISAIENLVYQESCLFWTYEPFENIDSGPSGL